MTSSLEVEPWTTKFDNFCENLRVFKVIFSKNFYEEEREQSGHSSELRGPKGLSMTVLSAT
jgi:hypothetical protein